MTAADRFASLLETAREDPDILALWLGGSRGKGMTTENSDYDCTIIVKDAVLRDYQRRLEEFHESGFDLSATTLDEFAKYAAWDSPMAWDRYNFAHTRVLVDKTGVVQQMIEDKACIPPSEIAPLIRHSLDHHINQVYRSLKNRRDGNTVASRLDAAEGINPLLDALFALHGRLRPYHKYLEWELKNFPLEKLALPAEELVTRLLKILTTGDTSVQQELFSGVESLFRSEGYGDVFDAWGTDLLWMKTCDLNSAG